MPHRRLTFRVAVIAILAFALWRKERTHSDI